MRIIIAADASYYYLDLRRMVTTPRKDEWRQLNKRNTELTTYAELEMLVAMDIVEEISSTCFKQAMLLNTWSEDKREGERDSSHNTSKTLTSQPPHHPDQYT